MTDTLNLEVVTPYGIIYSDNSVSSINVPSAEGTLGILPHHTSLFSQLTQGEVKITKGNEDLYLAIGGGFIEVFKNKVSLLVTRAVHADQLNEKEILEAQKKAEELLKEKPQGAALAEAQNLYRSTLIDLKVLRRKMRGRSLPQNPQS